MLTRLAVVLALLVLSFDCRAAITGFVLDEDGRPVANAAISVYEDETPYEQFSRMLAGNARERLGTAKSGKDGAFSISPEGASGQVLVHVYATGYLPAARTAEDGDRVDGLVLQRGEMRKGKVIAAGKPLSDAVVFIMYEGCEITVTTDAGGTFSAPWSNAPRSLHRIVVVHPDHAVHAVDGSIRTLDVIVPPSAPLRGRVVGPDGKTPASNATIRVDLWPLARSAADGSFAIERAPSRWSHIVAEHDSGITVHLSANGLPAVLRLQPAVTVHGQVTDAATRRGIADAIVGVNGGGFGTMVRTSADGRYSVRALDPQHVGASRSGFVPEFVTPDATGTADLALDRAAILTGIVVAEDNEPVAGALLSTIPDGSTRDTNFVHTSTRSGGDGRFVLRVAPDTPLSVEVSKTAVPTIRSESLQVAAGASRDIRLVVPTGIEVTGSVRDVDGNPLPGIEIRTQRDERTSFRYYGLPPDPVRTEADGRYSLRLSEGTYTFTFSADDVVETSVRGQRVAPDATNVVDVSLEPAFAIEGRVVRGGSGIAGAMIAVDSEHVDSVQDPPRAHADREGRFTLRGLPRGTHWVVASHRMFRQRIQLTAPSAGVVIELPEGGILVGKVVDRETGASISAFRAGFAINRSGISASVTHSPHLVPFDTADGTFRIEHVPAGTTDVVVEAPGYVQGRLKAIVEAGKEQPVTLSLERGAQLKGRVTADGAGLEGVAVSLQPVLRNGGSFQTRRVKTDSTGTFSFDGLARDEWSLTFEHRDYAALVRSVVVRDHEAVVDVALARGNELAGVVVAQSGEPLGDAHVILFGPDRRNAMARTGLDGSFRMPNVPSGPHQLRVEKPGFVPSVRAISLPSSALRIELGRGATVYGRVIGLPPEAVAQTEVRLLSRAGSATGPVRPDSTYSIEGAPIGEVRVRATTRLANGERTSRTITMQLKEGESLQHDIVFPDGFAVDGVVLLNGKPLPAARVTFIDRDSGNAAATRADASGSFRIGDLTSGTYTVEVVDDVTFASHSTEVEIRGPRHVEIAFSMHRVRGRVFYGGTSEVVQNASVFLEPRSGPRAQVLRTGTGLDGTFVFEFVAPGPWQLRVEKDGCETAAFAFEVDAQIRPIELRIGKAPVE